MVTKADRQWRMSPAEEALQLRASRIRMQDGGWVSRRIVAEIVAELAPERA